MIWRYTWRDGIPCSVTLFQLAFNIGLAATWHTRPLLHNLALIPLGVFLFWYNGLVASHNFVHTPWFKSDRLNRFYLALNSINLGVPQIHYRYEHLAHHHYGNDRPDRTGRTHDPTSTFTYGRNGQHENLITYCFLGLFRTDWAESWHEVCKRRETHQLYLELSACFIGFLGYIILSWQYFVYFYIPVFYLGWCLEHLENYYEHFGGTPENRLANSTSYYGWLYNALFCNEGYHQEHHLRPNVHWMHRPLTRQEFPELALIDRVILRFPPCLSFLDHHRIARHYIAPANLALPTEAGPPDLSRVMELG